MNGKIIAFPAVTINQEEKKPKKRRRGERKDGRVQRSWQYTRLDTGETDREWFYGHTGAEADRKKAEFQKAYYEQKEAMERKKKEIDELGPMAQYIGVSVSEWISVWRAKYKGSQGSSSKKSYDAYIKRINKHIGDMKLEDVREFHIRDIFNEINGQSDSMIKKVYFILNSIFRKAQKNKLIKDNPVEELEINEGTKGSHRALEKWERDLIFTWVNYHRAITWGAIMMLTGMRAGELAAFDCKNALMDERKIKIVESVTYESNQPIKQDHTKTEAGMRVIPMCDLLYSILLPLVSGRSPDSPVCVQANGSRITKSGLDRAFEALNNILTRLANGEKPDDWLHKKRRKKLLVIPDGISKAERLCIEKKNIAIREHNLALDKANESRIAVFIRAHDFRHTFATALYDAGVDIKTAQYLLGHKDIRTTMEIYTHLSEERRKRGAADMVNFLDGWISGMRSNLLEWCQDDVNVAFAANIHSGNNIVKTL